MNTSTNNNWLLLLILTWSFHNLGFFVFLFSCLGLYLVFIGPNILNDDDYVLILVIAQNLIVGSDVSV